MKKTLDLAKSMEMYFDVKIIGSAILITEGLDYELVNDIDIMMVDTPEQVLRAKAFITDIGFKEKPTETGYHFTGKNIYGTFTTGSLIFECDKFDKPLHFCLVKVTDEVYSVGKLVGEKFSRGSEVDIAQLKNILNKK